MGRNILGGIVGYVVLFIIMFITCTIAYLAMGTDTAFNAGTYDVSMTWIIISSVLSLIAGIGGGYAAARIGGSGGAVKILAGIILVMGLISIVIGAVSTPPAETRMAETPSMEAMAKAQTPTWAVVVSILLGMTGAFIGGSRIKKTDLS